MEDKSKRYSIIIITVLIIIFGLAIMKMPFEYYEFIRFFGFVGFASLGYLVWEIKKEFGVILLFSSLLINPFFRVYIGRTGWVVFDLIWIIFLFYVLLYILNIKKPS